MDLTNEHWEVLEPLIPDPLCRAYGRGRPRRDPRDVLNGILRWRRAFTVLYCLIKGLEYGCLGLAVGWVSQRPWGGAAAHMAVGFVVGSIFGGTIVALLAASSPEVSAASLVPRGVTEVLFPVGCSLVHFSAEALGTSMASHD